MNFIFKLFGWFFSNLLLIIIVLGVCYAAVYWDDPIGKDTPAGKVMAMFPDETEAVKTFVAKLKIGDDSLFADSDEDSSTASSTVIVSKQDAGDSADGSSGDSTSDSTGDTANDPATESAYGATQVSASLSNDGVVSHDSGMAVEPAQEMRIDQSDEDSGFVTPEIEQALSHIKADGSVADTAAVAVPPESDRAATAQAAEQPVVASADSPAGLSPEDAAARSMMIDARRAYLDRDYEASIAGYQKLIAQQKDNYDALGELGNVYYSQGDREKAADAYYQAATIMIAQGQTRRAASLIGFLRSVDEDKAVQLQTSINAARETPESL